MTFYLVIRKATWTVVAVFTTEKAARRLIDKQESSEYYKILCVTV